MPFIRRKVEPLDIRRQRAIDAKGFEEYDDVTNHALVGVLLQLSSVAFHAGDVFREVEADIQALHRRCSDAQRKLENLYNRTLTLNPKDVAIPMSDLGTEEKIPLHLHYKSSNSIEEEFFTPDVRSPCLIHLYQKASPDLGYGTRIPQSDDKSSSFLVRNRMNSDSSPIEKNTNFSTPIKETSPQPRRPHTSNSLLPTPEEKIKMDCAQVKAEVITVDTSGGQFERRMSLRRLQRSSVSAVRRRSMLKFRNSRATMSFVESPVTADPLKIVRPGSAFSDTRSNSSFVGRSSFVRNTDSPLSKRNVDAVSAKREKADESLAPRQQIDTSSAVVTQPSSDTRNRVNDINAEPADEFETGELRNDRKKLSNSSKPIPSNNDVIKPSILLSSNAPQLQVEHRISSGFCSGSERHSTTSEILLQHQHVAQALQQILSKPPHPVTDKTNQISGEQSNTSTMSISSQLSAIPHSSVTSFLSIDLPPATGSFSSQDSVSVIASSTSEVTPSPSQSLSNGRCSFSNPVYDYPPLLNSAFLTPIKSDHQSRDCNVFQEDVKNQKLYLKSLIKKTNSILSETPKHTSQPVSVFHTHSAIPQLPGSTNTLENSYLVGPDFRVSENKSQQKSSSQMARNLTNQLRVELKHQLEKQQGTSPRKPAPPRRTSSLKRVRDETNDVLPYMEPSSSSGVRRSLSLANKAEPKEISNNLPPHLLGPSFKSNSPVLNQTSVLAVTSSLNSATTSSNSLSSHLAPKTLSPVTDSSPSPQVAVLNRSASSVSSSPHSSCDNLTYAINRLTRKPSSASQPPKKPLRTKLLEIKTQSHTSPSPKRDSDDDLSESRVALPDVSGPTAAAVTSVVETDDSLSCISSLSTLEKDSQVISVASDSQSNVDESANRNEVKIEKSVYLVESNATSEPVKKAEDEDQKDHKRNEFTNAGDICLLHDVKPAEITASQSLTKQTNQKPAIKPKPKSFSNRPTFESHTKPLLKKDEVIQRTASARAAFFGLPLSTQSARKHEQQPTSRSATENKTVFVGETGVDETRSSKKTKQSYTNSSLSLTTSIQSRMVNGKKEENKDSAKISQPHPTPASPLQIEKNISDEDGVRFISNDVVKSENEHRNVEASVTIGNPDSPANSNVSFSEATENILMKNHKTDVAVASPSNDSTPSSISNPVTYSLPDQPTSKTISNSSTLESSLHSTSPNLTSAQNFKSFLLQNRSKPCSSTPRSATENLRRQALQESKLNPNGAENPTSNSASERMVTASDLRAVLRASKHGRKITADRPKSLAEYSRSSAQKNLVSYSGRRSTSRLRTPSNHMNAILENSDESANHNRRSTNVTNV